jgi:hypothetical protein
MHTKNTHATHGELLDCQTPCLALPCLAFFALPFSLGEINKIEI